MVIAAIAALLLAAGLVACGGGDSSNSTAAEASGQGSSGSKSNGGASKQGNEAKSGGEGKSEGSAGREESGSSSSDGSASDFVPKHHKDSGGGSQQYKVKGGDNSVQEFGGEANTSELDAAATALHNFLDARAEGNWAAACDYMSKSVIESFEQLATQAKQAKAPSCGEVLEKLTNPTAKDLMKAEAAKADVGSLRIEGERAFLIYTGIDGTVLAMPMANEGGAWKVTSLAGTPLS